MSPDSLPRVLVCALTAFACFYAPGRAIVGPSTSALPSFFARVLASAIVSTLIATGLAATDRFSLSALLAGIVLATVAAFLVRRLATTSRSHSTSPRDLVGPLVVILALIIYWPASPSFLGAADSTTYVATGISLAHHGSLAREDELGPTLPKPLRTILFDSMSQVLFSSGPPYRRMPGAMLIESLDATRAWSCFFPVPTVWAGIFVVARAPGGATDEEGAPGFAPVFAALALWSFWILARAWLGPGYGIVAVVLLGACAPFYGVARSPLSEPIASFFALGGLAVLANAGSSLRRSDAVLAGAALGAAVFTRVEVGLFLAMAFAISTSLKGRSAASNATGSAMWRRTPSTLRPAFFVSLAVVSSLVLVQAALVPGSYVSPLLDQLSNARVVFHQKFGYPSPPIITTAALLAAAAVYAGARVVGLSAIVRWGFVAGVLAGHAAASTFLWQRTPMWLSFYLGWPGLALAAIGAVMAWKDRARLVNAPLLLGLAAAVALILFYNPHVYPALPWGARRFVPLLLPSLILLGCYSAFRVASRSRLASLAILGVLAFEVWAGGHPIWGKNLMEEAWDQLAQINAIVPQGGTILFDREVSPMMVGPALWLIHDRNGIAVPPTGSSPARQYLPSIVWYYARKGPVYFVTRGAGQQIRTPHVKMELLGRTVTNLRFFEQTYDRRPEKTERYVMPIAVYRLDRALDPRGAPVPSFMISVPLPKMNPDEDPAPNAEE